jgi:hypothetical protein
MLLTMPYLHICTISGSAARRVIGRKLARFPVDLVGLRRGVMTPTVRGNPGHLLRPGSNAH